MTRKTNKLGYTNELGYTCGAVYLRKSRQCELLTNVQPGLSHASSRANRVRHMISHYTVSSRSSKQLPVPERTTSPSSVLHSSFSAYPTCCIAIHRDESTVYHVLPFSFRLERTRGVVSVSGTKASLSVEKSDSQADLRVTV
jgi:hypothetical protein